MTRAWLGLEHRLSIWRAGKLGPSLTRTNAHVYQSAPQFPQKILWKHQVDLLVIECCTRTKPSWSTLCNTWPYGPTTKGCITRWEKLGLCNTNKMFQGLAFVFRRPKTRFRCPMHNLSTLVGLIAEKSYESKAVGIVSDATLDPMPPYPGALIRTKKGGFRSYETTNTVKV